MGIIGIIGIRGIIKVLEMIYIQIGTNNIRYSLVSFFGTPQ